MDEPELLARECAVFARYLGGAEPSAYVQAKYQSAHELGIVEPPGGATRFDRALVALARTGPGLARAADAYARTFAKGGLLRHKLVLLLAILECTSESHAALDKVTLGTRASFLARSVFLLAGSVVSALALGLLLLPVRAWCALGTPSRARG